LAAHRRAPAAETKKKPRICAGRFLEQLDRIATFLIAERGEGFEILRRDVGKEADDILHAVLGRQQNIQGIAYQVESAGLYPVLGEYQVLRI
jgi:hypothetical protein